MIHKVDKMGNYSPDFGIIPFTYKVQIKKYVLIF